MVLWRRTLNRPTPFKLLQSTIRFIDAKLCLGGHYYCLVLPLPLPLPLQHTHKASRAVIFIQLRASTIISTLALFVYACSLCTYSSSLYARTTRICPDAYGCDACVCVCMDGCVGWSVVLVEHGASNSSVFHSLRFLFVSFFPFSPSLSLSRSIVRPFHFSDDPFRRFEGFAFKSFRFFGALNSMPRRWWQLGFIYENLFLQAS